jgi:hypothetical protein
LLEELAPLTKEGKFATNAGRTASWVGGADELPPEWTAFHDQAVVELAAARLGFRALRSNPKAPVGFEDRRSAPLQGAQRAALELRRSWKYAPTSARLGEERRP